ncbi:MAG: hypothetical protein U0930_12815 [Pirellulales bacterium]
MIRSFFILLILLPSVLALVARLQRTQVAYSIISISEYGIIASVVFALLSYLMAVTHQGQCRVSLFRTGLLFVSAMFLCGSCFGASADQVVSQTSGVLGLLFIVWGSIRMLGHAWDLAWLTKDDSKTQSPEA